MPGRRPRPPARPAARTPGAPGGREPTAGGPGPTFSSYNRANMNWDEVMEGFLAGLPPTLEQRRRILEPLTERQLAQSFRQVRLDRHDHVIAKHSKTAYPLPWHAVGVMKRLAEEPTAHDRRPMFISVLSNAVSEYWSQPIRNSRGLPPMARGHPPDARCGWPISSPRRIPHTSSGTGRTRFAYLRLHNGRGSARRVMEFFVHPGPERPLAHRRSSRAANAVEHGERPGRELPTGRGESVKYRMHVAVKMGGTR
jgi:hypothetical protein